MYVTDNTNIRWVKIFHLYKGFHRKVTLPGFFVKGSARVVEPPRIEYKGFKYKYSVKGDICRLYIVRSERLLTRKDSVFYKLPGNFGINIKKKSDPKSRFLNGPISKNSKRRKFLSLFKTII